MLCTVMTKLACMHASGWGWNECAWNGLRHAAVCWATIAASLRCIIHCCGQCKFPCICLQQRMSPADGGRQGRTTTREENDAGAGAQLKAVRHQHRYKHKIRCMTDGHAAQATEHALAQNGHYITFKNHRHSKVGLYPRTMH